MQKNLRGLVQTGLDHMTTPKVRSLTSKSPIVNLVPAASAASWDGGADSGDSTCGLVDYLNLSKVSSYNAPVSRSISMEVD